MAIFDFVCRDCGKVFDIMISHKDRDQVKCPECGSSAVKQKLGSFFSPGTGGSSCNSESCSAGCSG